MGNKFLANIRETDAIAHVVRCFDNDNVIHVANKVDPVSDIEVINTELALSDLESVDKQLLRLQKKAKGQDKEAMRQVELLEKIKPTLDLAIPVRSIELTDEEQRDLAPFNLLTIKPTLYIANVNEDGFENNPYLDLVRAIAAKENAEVVVICNKLESEIAELETEEKLEFLADLGMAEPGLNRVIRAAYNLLGLQTFFTAGVKEVRAWTVKVGATAPNAAGVIHTDFEKGFIRSETIAYQDFIDCKGEAGAKEAGKWRLEGKEYIVKDGDVMHFRFNV